MVCPRNAFHRDSLLTPFDATPTADVIASIDRNFSGIARELFTDTGMPEQVVLSFLRSH